MSKRLSGIRVTTRTAREPDSAVTATPTVIAVSGSVADRDRTPHPIRVRARFIPYSRADAVDCTPQRPALAPAGA